MTYTKVTEVTDRKRVVEYILDGYAVVTVRQNRQREFEGNGYEILPAYVSWVSAQWSTDKVAIFSNAMKDAVAVADFWNTRTGKQDWEDAKSAS